MELPKPVAWLLTRNGLDVLPSLTQFEPREFETFKIQKQEPLFTAEQVAELMERAMNDGYEAADTSKIEPTETLDAFRAAYCRKVEG